jgi:quercetin dioxygenase-like cupin family protein
MPLLDQNQKRLSFAARPVRAKAEIAMRRLVLGSAVLVATSLVAFGETHMGHAVATADAVQWGAAPPVFPKGAQMAVLSGDPGKPGPFTVRVKFPANYRIPAHHHPTYEAVTVLSGELHVGMGDRLSEANSDALGPGGFANLPANMNHFAFSGPETVVQINSEGPFAMTYVNPADDPSKTQ